MLSEMPERSAEHSSDGDCWLGHRLAGLSLTQYCSPLYSEMHRSLNRSALSHSETEAMKNKSVFVSRANLKTLPWVDRINHHGISLLNISTSSAGLLDDDEHSY